jgi:hypothetical protein
MFLLRARQSKLDRSATRRRPAAYRRPRTRPLVLEALEDRCLLSYSYALIADNGPDSFFSLGALNQPGLNDQGTVMFHSALKSGGEGVFTRDTQGSLGIIAITSDLARAFPLGGAINNAGTVSFGADLRAGGQALYTGRGQELAMIADTGPDSPYTSFLAPAAPVNNDETVAFLATLKSGGSGIFAGHAGELPRILYVSGGQFTSFLAAPIPQRNGDEMSFRATLNMGQTGVFLGDGLTTTTIATTGDTYSALAGGVPNDTGTVAFIASLTAGGQAVVTGDGTHLTTIADTSSRFSGFFGNATINNAGQVVFAANLAAGGSGIFIYQNGEVDEIIGTGASLFGSTLSSFVANPYAGRGFNNAGQLGFAANLEDGRTIIVRADPDEVAGASPVQSGFTEIAEFGPNSMFNHVIMNGTLNDQGTVTFRAALWSGGEGAFTRDMDGNLRIIAITNDVIRAVPIGGRINNSGTVSFGADLRDGTQAIFTGRGQELSRITDTGPDSPFSSILPAAADVTNDETLAFRATLKGSGQAGIFTERAGEPPRILYLTGGRFAALQSQNIQRTGNQVVFWATLSAGGDGLYRGDGVTTTTIATTGDTYSSFTTASVANDAGTVAFLANLTAGGQAILTSDGSNLNTVADTSGLFSSFTGFVTFNNAGQVVFAANLAAGGRGIFSARDGVIDKIIGTGDTLFGSTVSSLPDTPFAPRALNNLGQLGFLANLEDGRQVWVRADPVDEAPVPRVPRAAVNDGSAQRPMATSPIELASQGASVIDVTVPEAVMHDHSVDTLMFVGAGTNGASLAVGDYTLPIHYDGVHAAFGQALDGAGTGAVGSDHTDAFFRLVGDKDGDGLVGCRGFTDFDLGPAHN